MRVVINDANILIDLAKLKLLKEFSKLNFQLYSTDFVVNELQSDQRKLIYELVDDNELHIIETTTEDDFIEIHNLNKYYSGLSFEDCSVWYYSKKMEGILLTGDGKLTSHARNDGIEVRGIIFVFDQLIKQNIIDHQFAMLKINELLQLNPRLPKSIINQRISDWKSKL